MKYLLITPVSYSFGKYEMEEFDTPEELAAKVLEHGLRDNAFIAQRIGLQVQVCGWSKPEAKSPGEELQEAA